MIISRTPFRISFFGGGTDYPDWYKQHGGAVLATTIDKYCYINCRYLPPFFEFKHRIVYSKYEHINEIEQIVHPSVRETFRFMNVSKGLEIHHDGDLPARSGLGSSSAFTVGLLHALYALTGKMVDKKRLAMESIHIEQEMIRENVGSQDQTIVAHGGLNRVDFKGDHDIEVRPLTIGSARTDEFQSRLLLYFTGFSRIASEIAKDTISQLPKRKRELRILHGMVDEAMEILNSGNSLDDFGRLLDEGWKLKRGLSERISTPHIDAIYEAARKAGAVGGKLLGAGGGGFMLFFVLPEKREAVKAALGSLLRVPFRFETLGSQIIHYSESGNGQ